MTGIVLCIAILVAPTMYQQIVKHQDIQKEVEKLKEDFKEVSKCYSNDVTNFSNAVKLNAEKVRKNAEEVDKLINDIMKDDTNYVKMLSNLIDKLYEREQENKKTDND